MREKNDTVDQNVLVISEHSNPDKIKRHIEPLATVADRTKMVCLTPNENVEIQYQKVPTFGFRMLGIILIFFEAFKDAVTNDYDLVVSFSLFPYGMYALLIGNISKTPTHLGILGADLDVHAQSWYRIFPKTVFRQFGSLSVLGTEHKSQLTQYGVPIENIFILTNAIDTEKYNPKRKKEVVYDFVWSGRFAPEKDPLLFIHAIKELRERGYNVQAVMLGSGELEKSVRAVIEEYKLSDSVTLPGWINEPVEFYSKSSIFVLTSKREALGLSLLESMAMGLACITPSIGNIPDIATNEENVLLVDNRDLSDFVEAMERLLTDEELRNTLEENAISVGQSFSYESAEQDWEDIISYTI
ncbi:glycosyltransferase family 4 protein [Halostella sp. JP-L12]|uniref:glycosyltransferase family 4 protein n=1 Tax=Halostella TaxID=1843185 RepID=UPI0013CF3B1A|nr:MULTISPECIES: glycosyltransferase family 4 protein [Halostella]NHN46477.1 glycosyltransferase family 4 protein [Halostella sp. JP-L12]